MNRLRKTILNLSQLEDRTVPAGIVNATFSVGVLTLTAVNEPNDVNILGTNNQNITLDGAGGNDVTVIANNGETGTAITGSPFNNVIKIKLIMGLGNDTVTITDTNMTGSVVFKGGSGDNRLNIDGAGNFSTFAGASPGNNTIGNIYVTNGDGFDTFRLGGGTNAINGNVAISNGVGRSGTTVNVQGGDTAFIGGTFKLTNLAGNDDFDVDPSASATFIGKVTISNGSGNSDTEFDADFTMLTGGLSITNGAGNDQFDTSGSTFTVGSAAARRNLEISNGSGGSDTRFVALANNINGNLSGTATAGDDDLTVDGDNFNVLGTVTVSTGSGGGTTSFSPNLTLDIDGAISVTCAEGSDNLDFDGTTSVDLVSVKFSSGNGLSTLDFNGNTTTVTGAISHTNAVGDSATNFNATTTTITGAMTSTHGDGFDTFDVGGTNFTSGAITILNGAGGSDTFIDAATSNTINGAISITNGDGRDNFLTGGTTWTLGTAAARRNLTINNGNGDSSTVIFGGTVTFNGSIRVTNGAGSDDYNAGSTTFAVTGTGSMTISNGVGGSDIQIDSGTSTIGGKLTITATDGADRWFIERLTVTGATSLSTGNGDDEIGADDSTFNGAFTFTAGAGADLIEIARGSNNGVSTVFNGAVNINLGNGDDELLIGKIGDVNDFGDFNAAVTLAGGLDLDIILALANVNNAFTIAPVVTGFEQGT